VPFELALGSRLKLIEVGHAFPNAVHRVWRVVLLDVKTHDSSFLCGLKKRSHRNDAFVLWAHNAGPFDLRLAVGETVSLDLLLA
jgi:hypothetical protein